MISITLFLMLTGLMDVGVVSAVVFAFCLSLLVVALMTSPSTEYEEEED